MRVTSSASARVSGGRIEGSRRASIVLPTPGGPESSMLWPPAAAIVRAPMTSVWPRTSARSAVGTVAAAQDGRDFGERAGGDDVEALDERCLGRALARDDEALEARAQGALGDG